MRFTESILQAVFEYPTGRYVFVGLDGSESNLCIFKQFGNDFEALRKRVQELLDITKNNPWKIAAIFDVKERKEIERII